MSMTNFKQTLSTITDYIIMIIFSRVPALHFLTDKIGGGALSRTQDGNIPVVPGLTHDLAGVLWRGRSRFKFFFYLQAGITWTRNLSTYYPAVVIRC